jgi:hypothetical protein
LIGVEHGTQFAEMRSLADYSPPTDTNDGRFTAATNGIMYNARVAARMCSPRCVVSRLMATVLGLHHMLVKMDFWLCTFTDINDGRFSIIVQSDVQRYRWHYA